MCPQVKVRGMKTRGKIISGCFRLVTALLVAFSATGICAQNLPHPSYSHAAPQSKVVAWGQPAGSQAQHYGILGAVAQPAVYRSNQPATLQELVQSAGGLAPHASRSVRIIRGDRGGQTVYFSEDRQDWLQSGDFVVVDVQRSPQESLLAPPAATGDNRVYLGLLGVQPHPVVVPMSADAAYLSNLMLALGQSRELARSVRVMLPLWAVAGADLRGSLPSGTIVAVPPELLVAANLPAFPEPRNLSTARLPTEAETARAQSRIELPATTADFGPPPEDPPEIPVPAPLPPQLGEGSLPAPVRFADRDVVASPIPFSHQLPRETPANEASMPQPGTRLSDALASVKPAPVPPPARVLAPVTQAELDAVAQAPADLVGEQVAIEPQATFNLWQMLGIGATVFTLVGVALGTRSWIDRSEQHSTEVPPEFRRGSLADLEEQPEVVAADTDFAAIRRAHMPVPVAALAPPAQAATPAPVSQTAAAPATKPAFVPIRLSELLANSLPIETEPAELPTGMKLPGEVKADAERWRIDAAHAELPLPPHLNLSILKNQSVRLELDHPAEASVPRPHFRAGRKSESAVEISGGIEASLPAAELSPDLMGAATPSGSARTVAAERTQSNRPAFVGESQAIGKTSVERALAQLQRGRLS